MTALYLVELLGQQAVDGVGLAQKLESAASEAGHDGVTLASSVACSGSHLLWGSLEEQFQDKSLCAGLCPGGAY